jgi:hypothetical protein
MVPIAPSIMRILSFNISLISIYNFSILLKNSYVKYMIDC